MGEILVAACSVFLLVLCLILLVVRLWCAFTTASMAIAYMSPSNPNPKVKPDYCENIRATDR